MTQDDVLLGYRLQLFALAAERGVSQACRLMGVHRSTYYRWKTQVERQGLEMLRPRERRRPSMPSQFSALSSSGSWPSASGTPDLVRGGSRRAWPTRNGVGWSSVPTASTRRSFATT